MGEGNENESLMNDRPHPGLLPQEKENRSPRFGGADALGCRASFSTNDEAAVIATVTNKFSSDAPSLTLSSGERAGVRASVKSILCLLFFLLAFISPLLADDVITNVMSPIVSYQYPDNFSSQALANGGILSPIVSYQYFEWPGDDVLRLWSSPRVSYFYPGNDGPQILLQGRVTDISGTPLSGAAISVAFGSLPLTGTSTEANGNYTLPLGAGLYALTASASGRAKSSRVLTLSAERRCKVFNWLRCQPCQA